MDGDAREEAAFGATVLANRKARATNASLFRGYLVNPLTDMQYPPFSLSIDVWDVAADTPVTAIK